MKLLHFDPVLRQPRCARYLLVALFLGTGCGMVKTIPGPEDDAAASGGQAAGQDSGGSTAGTNLGSGGVTGGSGPEPVDGAGGDPTDLAPNCGGRDGSDLQITKHVFDTSLPWAKVLYTWTVPEQEAALRAERTLLTVGEVPGLGKGLAMDLLTQAAEESPGSIEAQVNEIFTEFRYAWTNPWATRIGPEGEDYGDRLVRMVLRDDAWVGVLDSGGRIIEVIDRDGNSVPDASVAASPERIAALYFARTEVNGSPLCSTFSGETSGGYREFIVGNADMLEEWSIGTLEIRNRIESDIAVLTEYAEAVSACPHPSSDWGDFNYSVVCTWGFGEDPYFNSEYAYVNSLALPSNAYQPTADNLSALITTLTSSLFELDPLVVVIEQ